MSDPSSSLKKTWRCDCCVPLAPPVLWIKTDSAAIGTGGASGTPFQRPARPRVLFAIALLCLLQTSTNAQNPVRAADAPAADPGFAGAETREEILAGPRWKKLVESFDDWMSVQNIYTEGQTAELVRQLKKNVATLTPKQLKDFIVDSEKRLDVLMSDEASEARAYLSVATMEYRQKMLSRNGMLLNVFGMSVAELRQELNEFQQHRASSATASAEFDRARQQRVADLTAAQRAQQQSRADARSRAARTAQQSTTRTRSPYVPRPNPPRNNRPQFYVNAWGGVSRALP